MNTKAEMKGSEQEQPNADEVVNNSRAGVSKEDNDQLHQPGNLDKIEGRMNNGEIGGGLRKEEE